MKCTKGASDTLDRAPIDPIDKVEDILAYNRACYDAQLGPDQRALDALRQAIRHDSALWKDACEDPDFVTVCDQLDELKP
ncbi:hypothetical protein N9260_02260 [bacterium]|nr:hypothetical protein [bacterium]